MSKQNTASLLWLGAGDIAQRCLPLLNALDIEMTCVSRSAKPGLNKFIQADISNPVDTRKLAERRPQFCVMSFSPRGRRQEDYERAYLVSVKNVLNSFHALGHAPRLLLFVSSTSVYPQKQGERVDEQSETQNYSVSSSTMLACEELLRQQAFATCAVRFSGIYGPGRYRLISQIASGKYSGQHWTNRIHVDDCAGVISFLIQRSTNQQDVPGVLLASDNEPVLRDELLDWFRSETNLNISTDSVANNQSVNANTETLERPKSGKRCHNGLLQSLGYRLQVPSYKEGFPAIVAAFESQKA